jgi:hypothetical protein
MAVFEFRLKASPVAVTETGFGIMLVFVRIMPVVARSVDSLGLHEAVTIIAAAIAKTINLRFSIII